MVEPCTLVLFGASGDLTQRMVMPAIVRLMRRGQLSPACRVIGYARSPMSDDEFRARMRTAVLQEAGAGDEASWTAFAPRVSYIAAEYDGDDVHGYAELVRRLTAFDRDGGGGARRLFYLAMPPSMFAPIMRRLTEAKLAGHPYQPATGGWARLVIEKPFGYDVASARALNAEVARGIDEDAVYRIDHFLGKEIVQSLFALRFANAIPEPVWNRHYIDHVQITAAETLGPAMRLQSIVLDYCRIAERRAVEAPSAYDHLLLDSLRGDPTFFARADEVEAAWAIVDPVITRWAAERPSHVPTMSRGRLDPLRRMSCCSGMDGAGTTPRSRSRASSGNRIRIDPRRETGPEDDAAPEPRHERERSTGGNDDAVRNGRIGTDGGQRHAPSLRGGLRDSPRVGLPGTRSARDLALWNQGSVVRSWLLESAERAFEKEPDLSSIRGYVEDSGEGRWAVTEAIDKDVPAPLLALSLLMRFRSRQAGSFGAKAIAALRNEFGGHAVKPIA